MTNIQACLNMLKNLPDSKSEIRKIKILIACHEWTESRQIAQKAGLKCLTNNGVLALKQDGLLERKLKSKRYSESTRKVHIYKTTPKGIEIITQLMK